MAWAWQAGKGRGAFGKCIGPRIDFDTDEKNLLIDVDISGDIRIPKNKAIELAAWILGQFGYDVEFQEDPKRAAHVPSRTLAPAKEAVAASLAEELDLLDKPDPNGRINPCQNDWVYAQSLEQKYGKPIEELRRIARR